MKRLRNCALKHLGFTIFLYSFMITASIFNMTIPVYSNELTVPEKALVFLENVVLLNMSQYEAILQIHDTMYPEELDGLAQDNVVYVLVSNENELEAAFGFKNGSFAHCTLGTASSPVYSEMQSDSLVGNVKSFLQRYQAYSGDADFDGVRDFEAARSILDSVDVTENVTTSSGGVQLEVICRTDYTLFVWEYVLDGVSFPWMSLEIREGIVCGFDDNWRLYTVGSTDIAFPEADAINIALAYLDDFSWNATQDNEVVEVTDFEVIEEPRDVELITTRNKELLTLYPCWEITLYLDDVYPGNVNRIAFAIWADTGEVISCIPLSGGGVIPEFSSGTIMLIISGVLAVALVFYKQRLTKK
ncbi:MAG: hypothetical protein NWF06_02740 [Candidatus Bathyarchaeota archaeon]|nr:hypothetical protein [Candidatus Bathyarchaeum sp.]